LPLAFRSRSHGTVAFGFFQIEVDMLLLQQEFFFADQFCGAVVELVSGDATEVSLAGFVIEEASDVGNVNAAVQGIDLGGFIGATYRHFPFPRDPAGFKQKPDGACNRALTESLIREYGQPVSIRLRADAADETVSVGEIVFAAAAFSELLAYVDRGGYPRWQNEQRPDYVAEMMSAVAGSKLDRPLH